MIARRRLCVWSLLSLLAGAMGARPALAAVPTDEILIAVLSTGHYDESVYASLEGRLRAEVPQFAKHLKIVRREAGFSNQHLPAQADEVLSLHPKLLICTDLTAALMAVSRRRDMGPPIVFLAHDDPLANGLIQSYARPGRNLTGVTTYRCVDGKMVEIMMHAFPGRKRFGYLFDSSFNDNDCTRLAEEAATRAAVRLIPIDIADWSFSRKIAAKLEPLRLDAVIAPSSAPLWQQRRVFVSALNDLHLPVIYESELFLREGGLMYYGPIRSSELDEVAIDVKKILAGELAGDVPVEQPTLFEFVINLRAPHASDYGISASAMRRADRILQ